MVKKGITLNERMFLHDKISIEKVDIEKFKNLIKYMYKRFPNSEYSGIVEQIVKTEKMREELEKSGFLIKEVYRDKEGKEKNMYMLGASALSLVSAWKTEELTKIIKTLTIIAVVFAGFSLLLNLFIILKNG